MIGNPILPGFHPDPSIIRVGQDFYVATSTFEWFPGVTLAHSRDLRHWRIVGGILNRRSQLDLLGVPDSGGVWAPSLSYADGRFWLVYTIIRTRLGPYRDMVNCLVTADSPEGPWSDPIFLNARGFDPSLFHDDDGRKWILQIVWDHRKDRISFGGIMAQEYDPRSQALIGSATTIFRKSSLIEGPNLYKRGGWYYLMLAEGGTSWNHSVSMARSKHLLGPYEADPQPFVLTARDRPDLALQKAGHGELVETEKGEWFMAYLASRPILAAGDRYSPMGRETCLQRVVWTDDGWLRLASGDVVPEEKVARPPQITEQPFPSTKQILPPGPEWMTLREPWHAGWLDGQVRPGWVRLQGRESLTSPFHQSLIARRVTSLSFWAETTVDFQPASYREMAGLVCFYNTRSHYYLRLSLNDTSQRTLAVLALCDLKPEESPEVVVPNSGPVRLAVRWRGAQLQFYYSMDASWTAIGPAWDASVLSDEFGSRLHFTGAFIGLCVQDLDRHQVTADFDGLRMEPLEE